MSRLIAVVAWGFMLAACSATMPNLNLDSMKPAPQAETLAIESEPRGAEAKTSLGQSCLTPCQLSVQPGSEFSVMLALRGYQPQTVSVRPEAEGATAPPRLRPNPVHVDLQPVTPKKPIAKKKKPVANGARRIIWQITSWNCSPVRRWELSPGAAAPSCDFRTFQVCPKDLRALPGHPEPAVSWHSGFRGGAHVRRKATPVHHAAGQRSGHV